MAEVRIVGSCVQDREALCSRSAARWSPKDPVRRVLGLVPEGIISGSRREAVLSGSFDKGA